MDDQVRGELASQGEGSCDPDLTRMLRGLPDPVVVANAIKDISWGNSRRGVPDVPHKAGSRSASVCTDPA